MSKKLTEGKEWKLILFFALPIMAGQLLQQLYNTVDGIVVGNFVSSGALAAVGSCGTLAMIFLALAMGMGNGSGIVIAQLYGARRMEEMRRAVSTALILLTVLGIAVSLVGVFSAEAIMTYVLAIDEPDIHRQAVVYFRIYALGLVFQFIYNAVAGILRSVGDSRATLYFLLVSAVANIIGDLLLVAVIPMGVAGAAIATVLSQAACAGVSLLYMTRRYAIFRFSRRELVFDREKFRLCLRMGIPTCVQQLVISGGNVLLQRLVNGFGAATMSAYTVGMRFDHYVAIPPIGFHTAMAAFAGQNTGAGKPERIRRGLGSVLLMDELAVVTLGAVLYLFAPQFARLFGVEGEALEQSVEFLRFMPFMFPLFAFYIPINGMLQGCGAALASMCSSLIALGLKVVGAYAMVGLFDAGYAASWQSNLIGWTGSCIFAAVYFLSGKWKTKGVVKPALDT